MHKGKNKNPLVSIIIPTYNRAYLIEETLKSILLQTYSFWECIIIDDGSTDDTEKIIEIYAKKDSRFQYYKRPESFKKGPSGCRNYGFSISNGKYINWFDSDDIMLQNKLETELNFLEFSTYDFCISQTLFFDHETKDPKGYWNKKLYSKDPLNDFIMKKIGWSTNAPLWRKESLVKHKLSFNENLFGPDDYDYHIKALIRGLKPIVIDKVHVKNRIHPNRIEYDRNKAFSKSIIVFDLLKYKDHYNLSEACINSQIDLGLSLIKNMYKHKRLEEGLNLSRKLYQLDKRVFDGYRLSKLFMLGLFYKMTNKGYSYFNKL